MAEKVIEFPRDPGPPPPPRPGEGWMQPFRWRDPTTIPQRRWLFGGHYIRRFVTTTVAPGGVGKSALVLVEALSMITGRDLVGVLPNEPDLRVWYWNGEDPLEETERRIAAAALQYGLEPAILEERLLYGSGRDADLVLAEHTRDGTEIAAPNVEALKRLFREQRIDVAIIDPFVSSHRVPENDNNAIDRVAKTWGRIADETNTGIELVHHVRKGVAGAETTVEDGRGAVALLAAARSARVLNVMSESEAEKAGVERRRAHFRVDNGKANLSPPPEGSTWYRISSQHLGNGGVEGGDSVGVVTAWAWPDHKAGVRADDVLAVQREVARGEWRESAQCGEWVGHAVARAMDLDASDKADRAKISSLLRTWIGNGALVVEDRKDKAYRSRKFVVVGEWVTLSPEVFE